MGIGRRILAVIGSLSLAQKFLALAALPVGINAYLMGAWVTQIVAHQTIHTEAASSAVYVESLIDPLLQELAESKELSPPQIAELQEVTTSAPFSRKIAVLKIWTPDGRVVYSNNDRSMGRAFPIGASLKRAFAGEVVVEHDNLDDEENADERLLGK